MKKMLKALTGLAVVAMLVVGVCATVFAAPSPQGAVDVDPSTVIAGDTTHPLTDAEADQLAGSDVTILQQWDMNINPGQTVTFTANGYDSSYTMFVYHFYDGAWHTEGQGPCPKITVTFQHGSPVAVAVGKVSGGGGGGTSPKTGQSDLLLFIALAAVAVGGVTAAVVAKNKA